MNDKNCSLFNISSLSKAYSGGNIFYFFIIFIYLNFYFIYLLILIYLFICLLFFSQIGAPISPAIVSNFYQQFSIYIHSIYGLTECTGPTHATPLSTSAPVDQQFYALSIG